MAERILYKRIGVLQHQQSRLQFLWSLRFLYQVGFVFSWTVLISLFVGHFGIENLIYFFLLDAGLFLFGSLLSTSLFLRMNLDRFLFGTVLCTSVGLLLTYFAKADMALFVGGALVVKNFFYGPMNVAIYRKNESLLSPDEARHMMPILDSAITIGLIVAAGALLPLLYYWPLQEVLYFWLVPLLFMLCLIVQSRSIIKDIPRIELSKIKESEKTHWIYAFSFIKSTKFLSLMLCMVLFQSALWSTSEFIFTKWVQEHVQHEVMHQPEHDGSLSLEANLFKNSMELVDKSIKKATVLADNVSGKVMANGSLAHYLGWFSLFFGLIALLVQLAVARRMLERWGVLGTMCSFFGSFSLVLVGLITGQLNMNWVRGFQHGFHSLFEVGYHMTFYSILTPYREVVRHLFEAIIKPLGVLLCFGIIWLFSYQGFDMVQVSYYVMLVLAAALTLCLYRMRHPYTRMTKNSFYRDDSVSTKIHIAEILGHKGHEEAARTLGTELQDTSAHHFVREKVIEQITLVDDPSILATYIKILEDSKESLDIKIKVLDSLLHLKSLRAYFEVHPFSRHKLMELLETLYQHKTNAHIRKLALMNLFAHRPSAELVPFFLKKVKTDDIHLKCVCLRSVSEIFEDPAMESYTDDFLSHPNPRVRGHAIIALWPFYPQEVLGQTLDALLNGESQDELIAAIYAIGEVKDASRLPLIIPCLANDSLIVRMHVLVAMAKLEDMRCLNCTMGILFGEDIKTAQAMFHMLRRTSPEFQARLRHEIQHQVSAEVMSVLEYAEINDTGETLSAEVLERLKHLYRLAGRFGDLWALEQITPKTP